MTAKRTKRRVGRPTLIEAEKIQRDILSIATKHFLRYGFINANVDRIAEECGITRDAIYKRYPNKAALITQVSRVMAQDIFKLALHDQNLAAQKDHSRDDFSDRLKIAARALLRAVTEPEGREMYRLLRTEVPSSPELEKTLQDLWSFYFEKGKALFRQAVHSGELRITNVDFAAEIFITNLFASTNMRHQMRLEVFDETELYHRSDMSVEMFLLSIEVINRYSPQAGPRRNSQSKSSPSKRRRGKDASEAGSIAAANARSV